MMTTEELEKKIEDLTARLREVTEALVAIDRGMSSQDYYDERVVKAVILSLINENIDKYL